MKRLFYLTALLLITSYCLAVDLYWIGGNNNHWDNPQNWALSAGGSQGNVTPTIADDIYYTDNSNTDCIIDISISVHGLHILPNYTSAIYQNSGCTIKIGEGNYNQYDGLFIGGDTNIEINGTFNLIAGTFTSTSSALYIGKKDFGTSSTTIFDHLNGDFLHNKGTVHFEPSGEDDIEFLINTLPNDRFHNVYIDVNGQNANTQLLLNPLDTIYTENNLTLYDGRVNGGSLFVEGDVLVYYSFTSGTTSLHFTGSKSQHLSLSGAESKVNSDVYIEKTTNNVTLSSICKFDNFGQKIYFNSGHFISTSTNLIVFGNNVEALNASSLSFVSGPARKVGNDAFEFPIGKNDTAYAPIAIGAPTNVTNQFTAEYFQQSPNNTTTNAELKEASINHISDCEYWVLEQTSGISEVEVSLSWESRSCGIDHLSDLTITKWNGTKWENIGGQNTLGNLDKGVLSSTNQVTSYGMFTLGSINTSSPLPIQLTSFTAQVNDQQVELNWQTSTEQNNAYFTVERSKDTLNWQAIQTVIGAGNSKDLTSYKVTDTPNDNGIFYYRLKQNDYDGSSSYSKLISVRLAKQVFTELIVYPNPINRKNHNYLIINCSVFEPVTVAIRSSLGHLVYKETFEENEHQLKIHNAHFEHLPPGIYFICISSSTQYLTNSLLID